MLQRLKLIDKAHLSLQWVSAVDENGEVKEYIHLSKWSSPYVLPRFYYPRLASGKDFQFARKLCIRRRT